jgi:hypothetical protein
MSIGDELAAAPLVLGQNDAVSSVRIRAAVIRLLAITLGDASARGSQTAFLMCRRPGREHVSRGATTGTTNPLVANSVHGGRPGASEHGSGRSKATKTRRSHSRCCTLLLYFSNVRTERPDCTEPVTYPPIHPQSHQNRTR